MAKLITLLFCCYTVSLSAQSIPKWRITDIVHKIETSDSVLIINFWATFCGPCIEEIPDLIKYTNAHKKDKVQLYLVSLDMATYYPAKIRTFVKVKKWKANIAWLNETDADYFCPFIDADWSGSLPATIIINNKKKYKKFYEKKLSAVEIQIAIKEAL
jgi:thiol-disulfide isomerase/thioredoxin